MKIDEGRIRQRRVETADHAAVVNKLVDSIVGKYLSSLNHVVENVKTILDRGDTMTDQELEDLVMRIPVYIYFAAEGLESLGVECDMAKANKNELYSAAFMTADGTIKDKEAQAVLSTLTEQVVEDAYQRAYKKLKTQIEKAEHVFSGAKKVLSKRMQELDINRVELQYGKNIHIGGERNGFEE